MKAIYLLPLVLLSAAPTMAAEPLDYLRDVKPILRTHCFTCHSAVRQKAGLRLDAASLIRKGGKHGPALVPGKSGESLLIKAVLGLGRSRMPPESEGEALAEKDITALKSWIDQGAHAPDEPIPDDPRTHWAFHPPVRPVVPPIANLKSAIRNPIDAFVAAERERHGLIANPPADRATLLRRVYLDLIGVPPTRDELHAFLADNSPDCLREGRGSSARLAAVWRALGPALAGCAGATAIRSDWARSIATVSGTSGAGAIG